MRVFALPFLIYTPQQGRQVGTLCEAPDPAISFLAPPQERSPQKTVCKDARASAYASLGRSP